ncbi:MAG: hypothetical protein LUD77_08955 [Clostridiales bacterium]|nr:hypothetical protein [Clostridiales bacterium]
MLSTLLEEFISFTGSVLAGVVSYYICKLVRTFAGGKSGFAVGCLSDSPWTD